MASVKNTEVEVNKSIDRLRMKQYCPLKRWNKVIIIALEAVGSEFLQLLKKSRAEPYHRPVLYIHHL